MDNKKISASILKGVGGEANVDNVYHCATRLRFTLKDESLANKEDIEALEGVITVVESGGMFQVVIGNNVNNVYAAMVSNSKLEDADQQNNTPKKKQGLLNSFLDMIAGVFAPTLGVLAGSGLIKGVLVLLTSLGVLTDKSGTYVVLNTAADTFFYFLPVFLAYTAAKKFKTDPFIAMTLGASLIYPTIVAAYTNKINLDFVGIPVILAKYTSTVIPAILAVWVLSYLERFIRKHLHESVVNLLTPFFSLIIMVPLTLMVVGPIADYASQLIAGGYSAIYNFSPILSGAAIGGLWQVLVIFGLHWGLVPVMTNNISFYGRDTLGPGCMTAVAAQAGAVFAVFLKTKDTKLKSLSLSSFISALFGITEPAVYGITLKYKKPFIIACVTGAVFGGITGAVGSAAVSVATRSVLSFPIYIGKGFAWLVACYFLSMITSCVLTYLFGYKDEIVADVNDKIEKKPIELRSPAKGKIIDLMNVNDATFASGALGDGFAVEPTEGNVYSPIDGEVMSVFPTKHAIGITGSNGAEILVHIGIDTVDLNGKYFESKVQDGQNIRAGDLLTVFDLEALKKDGYDPTIMVIVTNSNRVSDITISNDNEGAIKEDLK
ncbi:beta-glucoside-specific PTS transporter subunit IIABC [Dellaglioa algida]|uniref:PTS system sucrose-specific EIIBCA component n=1 Tax=Dellaglioa algida TaxID=105612 RepID=A0A5C6M7J8_9LACO|nr:beta-glucoside-specific PTS transporter subunit IIABC [Dellaglioa algida]MDK1717362.1 beta-glucoside-specific PTS transporter subunit IIABC [Dellaglioa algida]MDK1720624.1 beta-glucoside-specific PTS transporter subunit IIABC [Dellaglioa algida]MDK1722293.1 beta-glucoside-specific PTS transporter subunit IIABC [Dellaglioa algida]MDK1723917.1 beta-glucoside-specific PTS transporter subunit IIABC [Dellaglioa algida]MDK1725498.1 beta-glucoside-specific PTS transporter subunit IIABC [Dellaglioa